MSQSTQRQRRFEKLFPAHDKTDFSGLFILCEHLVSLLLSFLLLQHLPGQRVTVVVSGQQAEVAVLLRVEVETRQLWQHNGGDGTLTIQCISPGSSCTRDYLQVTQ